MAGEYYRWLARNEKPEEKRELTPKEKLKNWWHYNKWYVLLGILAAAGLIGTVIGFVQSKNDQPDYRVAYVGSYALPDSTVEQLETALVRFGEDRNENGKVTVEIHQYLIYADEDENAQVTGTDASYVYAGMVQLEADLILFPPFSLYLCSVITKPAFLRSFIALLVVDSDSFRSLEIVGMDGQQMPSLLARSARYLYTEIALWGRSIRYSSVKLRILFPPVQVGLHCPTCFYVLSAVFSGIEAAFRFAFAGRVSSEYTSGYSDRIAFSRIAFPA